MKKYIFILILVFVFSLDVFSASLYEELFYTSDINYRQGQVKYIITPLQYVGNYRIDGFDHQLDVEYAVLALIQKFAWG